MSVSAEILEDMLGDGPIAVLHWRRDADWRAVDVSPNVLEMLGHPAEVFLSGELEYADLLHEQDGPAAFEQVGLATAEGARTVRLNYRIRTRDGETKWILDHTRILRDGTGEPTAFISFIVDVTGRRREEAKSEFVAHMSHEIRTPLSGVLGLVEALRQTSLDRQQKDMLETMSDAGAALLQLLNNVLDLSKIEAGEMTLQLTDFNVDEACRSAEKLFLHRAREKGVALTAEAASACPPLRGDPGRLRQIVNNLVSNAVKFTDHGEVVVRWRCAPIEGDDRVILRISVSDSGVGIPQDKLDEVFDKYRQSAAGVAAGQGGTGLGLAICKRLAAMMGGKLWAESPLGAGATFIFEAPFETATEEQAGRLAEERRRSEAESRAALAARGLNVLIVEDSLANQRVLELLLRPLGAAVTIAGDGREALRRFAEDRFDVVLMDSRMPKLGGIETTIEIRRIERDGDLARTPILALSAETVDDMIEAFREAGADDYMSKPFEPARLYRVLARLTRGAAGPALRAGAGE